jgi:acetate---CoA ligase (ADP-forming)
VNHTVNITTTNETQLPVTTQQRNPVTRLLDPQSIAVIGASTDPSKRGHQAIRALRDSGYIGPIYPVNPRATQILGLEVNPSIGDLPYGVDVALIALPGHAVPETLRECADAGIATAVVLANGFREIGDSGAELDRQLLEMVAETGIRVLGPNTSGMLNVETGANLVGLPNVPPGPISVVTQSGNMLLSLVNDVRTLGTPGINAFVGLGNQADIRYDECLTELAAQPSTRAIAIHTEGFVDGRAFLTAAAQVTTRKPVVLLRGGRSAIGQRTSLSHTGAVAGSDEVANAVLRQAGIELVERSDELAPVAGVLATTKPVLHGKGVVVLSDGGGHATLAVDSLVRQGVPLCDLSRDTQHKLRELLGPAAAVRNPIDVAGATDADPTRFVHTADVLVNDPGVGLILIVGMFGGYHSRFDPSLEQAENQSAQELLALTARYQVPVVVQSCYAGEKPANLRILQSSGIQVLQSIDHATRAVAALHRRGVYLSTFSARSPLAATAPEDPLAESGGALDEPAARRLLATAGFDVGAWHFTEHVSEVAAAVDAFGSPCALKVISPHIIHKSDAGAVALNVTATDVVAVATALVTNVKRNVPDADISGILITPMADAGVELLIGATRDPIFGPVVAFGSGGIAVEVDRDITFRAAPLTLLEANEMIDETRISAKLAGYRHVPPVDRTALAEMLVQVGQIVSTRASIRELDLNPVIASGSEIVPADVRVILSSDSCESSDRTRADVDSQ